MLIDLLSPLPGAAQSPAQPGSIDRLFTGNYKSNGNLVSLKVDIIDFTDFQSQGCLASGSSEAHCQQPHHHNISGTLHCHPETNTVRLNITLLPTSNCNESVSKCWTPTSSETILAPKEVKSWPANLQPMKPAHNTGPNYPHDPPPLLDFHPDQLMSDIQNITFDLKDQLPQLPQLPANLYPSEPPQLPAVTSRSTGSSLGSNPLLSQQFLLSQPVDKPGTVSHPTLLQPKLERSDSICSEYTPLKEEFLSYPDDLAGLDDLDNDNSLTPPTSISSPLLFSPTQNKSPLNPQETNNTKNTIFFNKSFESKPTKLPTDSNPPSFNMFPSSSAVPIISSTTSQVFTSSPPISSLNLSVSNETRKPFTLSHNDSPKSFSSSPVSSPHDNPITLLTSPKCRNRRNSSFDETKPHVCNQCGARFTTKSNLGQHAKIHLAVKPFICEICNHGFTRAAHYESHVAKHKGLKTHRCDQCGESFARLDNLLRHSARHKHGKIFDCSTCGKGFHRKDKLLEHEKVHSEYSFPCHKCSKTFHTNDALKHHLPLHEDLSKTQCKICLKFINCKSLSKHMSAFHKESVASLNENNNITNTSSNNSKSKSRARSNNNNTSNEKLHGCQYCKKSFVSPAKLRLHTAKFHAEERLNEVQPPIGDLHHQVTDTGGPGATDARLRFYDDNGPGPRYPSPSSSDGLPSQQVPEMEMSYINSSPETDMSNVSEFPSKDHLPSLGGNSYSSIPTIHIPEFDHIQSRMGDNGEISTEAIQALLFS